MTNRIIRALTFELDGSVSVEYFTPSIDARGSGLVLNHVVFVPSHHADLEDERMALVEAAHKLLDETLEVFANERDEVPPPAPAAQVSSGPFNNPEDDTRYGRDE